MILIYCSNITSRKEYVFRHVFKRILEVEYKFTTELNEFVGYSGPKFSYTQKTIGQEMSIYAEGLLDEVGIDLHEVEISYWDELPVFFQSLDHESIVPFDLFSAVFYLLSRYEEYLPQMKDELGRFKAQDSVAYQNDFLKLPIIELWVFKFKTVLEAKFDFTIDLANEYKQVTVIDTPIYFKYRSRSWITKWEMFISYVKKFSIYKLILFFSVLLRFKKDPFDNLDDLLKIFTSTNQTESKSLFLFNLGNITRDNPGVSYRNHTYKIAIKHAADYCDIGVLARINSSEEQAILQATRFEKNTHRILKFVRVNKSKLEVPHFYRNISGLGKVNDYSMCFENVVGFRAGTSLPFYFYDLDYEIQTPVLVHPVAIHYSSLVNKMLASQRIALKQIVHQIKAVHGHLNIVMNYDHFDKELGNHSYTFLKDINGI